MRIVAILTLSLVLQAIAFNSASALNIAASAEEAQPLQPGQPAPAFTVYKVDGSPFVFDPDKLERPAMIITFRGGWCPYCNLQLQDLRHVIPELKSAGFDVLFLSADRPEILYSSLKEENQNLDYQILSDSKLEASSALGIAFRVPDAQLKRMREFGLDLAEASGETHNGLPVPAVFIVDRSGTITYTYANPDYSVRLSAAEVRDAALGKKGPAL
jgi:peroxiredoxin